MFDCTEAFPASSLESAAKDPALPDAAPDGQAPSLPARAAGRAARLEKFKREQLIVDYLNRGVSVAEIAARVGVGEKRMRAIIREILARRMPAPPAEFVAIQVSRLNEALLVAYSAMGESNLKAVDRVVKIVRELDRYHGFTAGRRFLAPSRLQALSEDEADELASRPEIPLQGFDKMESGPEGLAACGDENGAGRARAGFCEPDRRRNAAGRGRRQRRGRASPERTGATP